MKPSTDIKTSTDAEGSTDKLNNNYQLTVTVHCIIKQTVTTTLAGVTSTLEAQSNSVDLGILEE